MIYCAPEKCTVCQLIPGSDFLFATKRTAVLSFQDEYLAAVSAMRLKILPAI